MNSKEDNKIKIEQISIFDEILFFIELNEINKIIKEISKNILLDGLIEEEEIKYEKNDMNSSNISFKSNPIKTLKFPNYDGSFKNDTKDFINKQQNKDLKNLYEIIIKEIQKIYHGYTHVESKLYNKINYYIQFSHSKNNTPMEIITKLKEINETLTETIKFIELYLYKNFQILQKIFAYIDKKLSKMYEVESISLYFLLDIFDLPNNELSYMLMFKIIDEESCVLKYIVEKLDNQIKDALIKNNNKSENNEKPNDNEDGLLDNTSTLSSEAFEAMLNIRDKYINKIKESIINIDSYSIFRAKYYNKYIYLKGNYEIDTNVFLNYIIEDNDDNNNNEDFLPINSLMDEEVIINKFIKKKIINKFLNFFKSQLPNSFKYNENLIMLHSIQNKIISIFVIYSYNSFDYAFINIFLYYIGRIVSKIVFNSFIKKRKLIKNLLITSNIILICSLFIHLFMIGNDYYNYIYFISKFLIGLSFSKNIETKFILNYVPKLLVKKTIKKYYTLNFLSISLGFFITSIFNHIFSFIEKNEEENKNKLNINNIGEIIFGIISLIILIINFLFFKEPKYNDLIKINNRSRSSSINIPKGNEKINNKANKNKIEDKKDATSIISYGKAKLISFKEKNKAKLLEESLKLDVGEKNYEGANQILNILQKLIINENTSKQSYTTKVTKGYILLNTILYIISSLIIFYNPLINASKKEKENINIYESKYKIWVFGFSYLLSYFFYIFKIIKISSNVFVWNVIILIFICFEISLNLLFVFFDQNFYKNTPIGFDNYFFYVFLSLILFFNINIEISCLKAMIREIPIEKKISSINIDNFLDIYEYFIKSAIFGGFYILTHYKFFEEPIYIKIIIGILYILACIIFVIFNYNKRQIALIKIINKITYESF